jgi:hypothetical protein
VPLAFIANLMESLALNGPCSPSSCGRIDIRVGGRRRRSSPLSTSGDHRRPWTQKKARNNGPKKDQQEMEILPPPSDAGKLKFSCIKETNRRGFGLWQRWLAQISVGPVGALPPGRKTNFAILWNRNRRGFELSRDRPGARVRCEDGGQTG